MSADQPTPVGLSFTARWVGLQDAPPMLANQMIGQVHEGEITLTFGYVSIPAIRTPEEAQEASEAGFLPIRPVARVALTRRKLEEVQTVIADTLANYERQEELRRAGKTPGDDEPS